MPVDPFSESRKAVLAADGVTPAKNLLVRAPALADLPRNLLLDGREGGLAYAAYLGGLVLDSEQHAIPIFDGLLL
jgi:hypothetical protein